MERMLANTKKHLFWLNLLERAAEITGAAEITDDG
jgi:hypothetical protein